MKTGLSRLQSYVNKINDSPHIDKTSYERFVEEINFPDAQVRAGESSLEAGTNGDVTAPVCRPGNREQILNEVFSEAATSNNAYSILR